ncbi:LysR family transcriptional regulator [Nocardioides sp. GCM10027113]|uniref:LysR family transcriptional regulator n=1 Tax=unclassified Nocardioides TaxID=2615069 RepID=UPI003606AE30
MRTEQLEYVVAVMQLGSLRRASERLHLSMPALSEAVSKLERELGVPLLDRRRSGARPSRQGQELMPHVVEVLEAVDRLRQAAGDHSRAARLIRVGTVNAATSTLLVPAVSAFQGSSPGASVEVVHVQQAEIDLGLGDGSLDLGLVTVLGADEPPLGLVDSTLAHGRPVVVLPAEHPLAAQDEVTVDQLRREQFVMMRPGYLMHDLAQRVFGSRLPATCHSTDGAEMGKVMVAEGLGVTLLPTFSITGDPWESAGLITHRPLAEDPSSLRPSVIRLVLRHRQPDRLSAQAGELRGRLLARARELKGRVGPRTA